MAGFIAAQRAGHGSPQAYGLGLTEYLEVCEREGMDPVEADRVHIAKYVREMAGRPGKRGGNVLSIDSGAGLANATLQQRLVPVRLANYRYPAAHGGTP